VGEVEARTRIREQAAARAIRLTLHAHQEMVEEGITVNDLHTSLEEGILLENYPDHRRGPCCLVCGQADSGRFVHIVCTTELPDLVIITVYEPKPPKWETPFKRGSAS
jgi:hypothetical protein